MPGAKTPREWGHYGTQRDGMSVPLFHTAPLLVAIFFCLSDNLELAAILARQVQMHRGRVGQNTKEEVIGNLLKMIIRLMGSLIFLQNISPSSRD